MNLNNNNKEIMDQQKNLQSAIILPDITPKPQIPEPEPEEILIKDTPEERKIDPNASIKLNFSEEELSMLAQKHENIAKSKEESKKKKTEKEEENIGKFKKKDYKSFSHYKRKLYFNGKFYLTKIIGLSQICRPD